MLRACSAAPAGRTWERSKEEFPGNLFETVVWSKSRWFVCRVLAYLPTRHSTGARLV